jgi:hypothetical protein
MIVSKNKKIAVYLNPKTGTSTLMNVFRNIPGLEHRKRTHKAHNEVSDFVAEFLEISDFETYKFFVFYRDPVERCISAYKSFKRMTYMGAIQEFFPNEFSNEYIWKNIYKDIILKKKHEHKVLFNKYDQREYDWLPEEIKQKIETITIQQAIHSTTNMVNVSFIPQTHWLDYSDIDINYLSFKNFDSEVNRLLSYFDIQLEEIPKVNETKTLPTDSPPTEEEVQYIMNHYQQDYQFFDQKSLIY